MDSCGIVETSPVASSSRHGSPCEISDLDSAHYALVGKEA